MEQVLWWYKSYLQCGWYAYSKQYHRDRRKVLDCLSAALLSNDDWWVNRGCRKRTTGEHFAQRLRIRTRAATIATASMAWNRRNKLIDYVNCMNLVWESAANYQYVAFLKCGCRCTNTSPIPAGGNIWTKISKGSRLILIEKAWISSVRARTLVCKQVVHSFKWYQTCSASDRIIIDNSPSVEYSRWTGFWHGSKSIQQRQWWEAHQQPQFPQW